MTEDTRVREDIHSWLSGFDLDPQLREHVRVVVDALPESVRNDFMGDPRFQITDITSPAAGEHQVVIGAPDGLTSSRAVVLKRKALRRPRAFVRWLIAHELAHAHLRNEGRFNGEDPEHAADALALEWGFPRPAGHGE